MRRALQLASSGGLELYERIEAIFAALPNVDWPAAHTLSDQLGSTAQEQRFEAFYSLFLDLRLARLRRARRRLIRHAAGPPRGAGRYALAQRLIWQPEALAPAWAELWETVVRERDEAVLLNLDRKALNRLALGTLAVARAGGRGAYGADGCHLALKFSRFMTWLLPRLQLTQSKHEYLI